MAYVDVRHICVGRSHPSRSIEPRLVQIRQTNSMDSPVRNLALRGVRGGDLVGLAFGYFLRGNGFGVGWEGQSLVSGLAAGINSWCFLVWFSFSISFEISPTPLLQFCDFLLDLCKSVVCFAFCGCFTYFCLSTGLLLLYALLLLFACF